MKVRDCMSRNVQLANPDQTIQEAAMTMARIDAGAMPVGDGDRLVGMLTDRDIAVRAVAHGMGPETKVHEAMTREIKYCFDDEDCDAVIENMADIKVRRLAVVNRDKRLVGIVSLGDLAQAERSNRTAMALDHISRPGGQHSQTAH